MKKYTVYLFFILLSLFNINNNIFSQKKYFVSLINAYFDEKEGNIVVSWEPLDNPKAIYKIYRLDKPLESKTFLPALGELIKVLDYKENTLVDVPPLSGKYYYYVSVTSEEIEDNQILIDQNYTYAPIQFLRSAGIISELKAKFIPQNSEILLKWNPPSSGEKLKGYVIYRSVDVIDQKTLGKAQRVVALPSDQTVYYDKIEAKGQYYYAVTTLSMQDFEGLKLVPDDNVLSKPVVIATLDSKKLPDFYIFFPLDLDFRFEPNISWIKAPESLDLFPLDISTSYEKFVPEIVKEKPVNKNDVSQKNILSAKDVKLEVEEVNKLFLSFHQQKNYYDFIGAADQKLSVLKSIYAGQKLKFYQAFSFYKLSQFLKAKLIINALKTDRRFMKYNRKKVLLLEKKIQENL